MNRAAKMVNAFLANSGKIKLLLLAALYFVNCGAATLCCGAPVTDAMLDAIAQVESGGDCHAVGDAERAVGAFQIRPIYVRDVNRLNLKKFTLADRWDYKKSREMTRIYLTYWGKGKTLDETIALHNGGPSAPKRLPKSKQLQNYVRKVKKEMEAEK